jgi:hypothetical protein
MPMNFSLRNVLRGGVILCGCLCSMAAIADMSDGERKHWYNEKLLRVKEFEKKYDDEFKRIKPIYESGDLNAIKGSMKSEEPFVQAMRSDITRFLRLSDAEALQNFKDNPLCVNAVKVNQPIIEDVSSGKLDPLKAVGNYPLGVLALCALSPKAGQFLEKQRSKQ